MKSNCLAWAEAARPLGDLLLLDGDDVDRDAVELGKSVSPSFRTISILGISTYAHALQQVLGLLVHIEHAALGVLGEVESRHLWDVLVLPLTLLLLQLEGDTTDRATLDTLHQVGGVAGNLESGILAQIPSRDQPMPNRLRSWIILAIVV